MRVEGEQLSTLIVWVSADAPSRLGPFCTGEHPNTKAQDREMPCWDLPAHHSTGRELGLGTTQHYQAGPSLTSEISGPPPLAMGRVTCLGGRKQLGAGVAVDRGHGERQMSPRTAPPFVPPKTRLPSLGLGDRGGR